MLPHPPPPARAPLSARQGQCVGPLGSGCRHPGALFPDLLPSEKQVSVPGALPPAVRWPSPICEQTAPPGRQGGALAALGSDFPRGLSICSPGCPH